MTRRSDPSRPEVQSLVGAWWLASLAVDGRARPAEAAWYMCPLPLGGGQRRPPGVADLLGRPFKIFSRKEKEIFFQRAS
jgi:hypothetical protein